jgi:hypothetical protein
MLEQFGDARVFAIDDNKTNLELLQALLTRAGLRKLYTSNDPIDALVHPRISSLYMISWFT